MQRTELNIGSSYKGYKETSLAPVDKNRYKDICNQFMQHISSLILEGDEVCLPCRLGVITVTGRKKKLTFNSEGKPKLPPDWRKTKELWERNPLAKEQKKLVYCLNEHSSGVIYKIVWSKKNVFVENKLAYALRFTRKNKRAVHKAVLSGKEYLIKTEVS